MTSIGKLETKDVPHRADPAATADGDGRWARTYTYVRLTIAALLVALVGSRTRPWSLIRGFRLPSRTR